MWKIIRRSMLFLLILVMIFSGYNFITSGNLFFEGIMYSDSVMDMFSFAVKEDSTEREYEYPLCENSEDIKALIMEAIYKNETSIDICLTGRDMILSTEELFNLVDGINSLSYSASESRNGVISEHIEFTYTDYYAFEYAFTNNDLSRMNEKQYAAYDEMLNIINMYTSPENSDYENALILHDVLVKWCVYDIEGIEAGTLTDDAYSAYGTVILGESVCSGYAEAYRTLLMMAGIESIVISGTADEESHAWNLVKIGDSWYHVDVTWDDPVPDTGDYIYHNYFMLTDTIMSADHIWEEADYPKAESTAYNYFYYNNYVADTKEKIDSIIDNAVSSGADSVSVLWTGEDEADLGRVFYHYYSYTLSEHSYGDEYRIYNIRFKE